MKMISTMLISIALMQFDSRLNAFDNANTSVESIVLDRIVPARGIVKLGAANSSSAWFAVREEGAKLVWTKTPFSSTSGIVEANGDVQHEGVSRWIPWSNDINNNGLGAITAGAYDSGGSVENGIVIVDTTTRATSFVRVGKLFPHWVKVDGKNRIWVIGTPMASIREEEPGDLPMIRVYSRQGVELARGFPRSITGEAHAARAMNLAFTEIVGEDYLVQIQGHCEIHRISFDEKTRALKVNTIAGPEVLTSPKAHLLAAAECGNKLSVRWKNGVGGVGFMRYDASN